MKPLQPESRRIIEQARAADTPAGGDDARIWQALSERLDGPLSSAAAAAAAASQGLSAGSSLWSLFGTKLAIGAAALCGFALVGAALYPGSGAQRRPSAVAPAPQAAQIAAPASSPPQAHSEAPPAASKLSAETRLIADAQSALNDAQAGRALALLRRHEREFADGFLAPERDAARVFALCALGRIEAARKARQRFLRAWPESPLIERVRAGCLRSARPR